MRSIRFRPSLFALPLLLLGLLAVPLLGLSGSTAATAPVPIGRETLLDEVGRLLRRVPAEEAAAWKTEIKTTRPAPSRAALLHLRLGEWELAANEEPGRAEWHFKQAQKRLGYADPQYGLASYNRAMALFYLCDYDDAAATFLHLLRSRNARGFDPRRATLWHSHAAACAGYHEEHAQLGIPQPPRLDPECGAAGLAMCLRKLGLPHDKKTVLANCRVGGRGSGGGDLVNACGALGGVTGRVVRATEKGLRALPKPLIAFVEHDHWVAVLATNAKGVTYSCSDCGGWPGGTVTLTWKQWRAMDADVFVSVVKKNSVEDQALEAVFALPPDKKTASVTRGAQPVRVAGLGRAASTAVSASSSAVYVRLMNELPGEARLKEPVIDNSTDSATTADPYNCGGQIDSLRCLDAMTCPTEGSGVGEGGPSCGDPVNLATLEEEYTPEPDLSVYNPQGPSITWSRLYNSARAPGAFDESTFLGVGWSHPYNVFVWRLSSGNTYLYLANGSRLLLSGPAPTANNPVVRCGLAREGLPFIVERIYAGGNNQETFRITYTDGSRWLFDTGRGTPQGHVSHYLNAIQDRMGNQISINNSPGAAEPFTIRQGDASGPVLFSVHRGSSPGAYYAEDCYGRRVYYRIRTSDCTVPLPDGGGDEGERWLQLGWVSQVVPASTSISGAPMRYEFNYSCVRTSTGPSKGNPMLTRITVPSPTGGGTSSAFITYKTDGTLYVESVTDGNGNTKTFTRVSGTKTRVVITDRNGAFVHSYTVGFDNLMAETSRTDGSNVNRLYQASYGSNPFKPTRVIESPDAPPARRRTTLYQWDPFGQPTSQTTPRNVTTSWTYDTSVFVPFGRLLRLQEGSRAPTTFTYFEPSGLVETVTGPSPAGGNAVASFTYDGLGNVLSATGPGNNAASQITTTFHYEQDGGYTQPAAIGQPLVVTNNLNQSVHLRYDERGNATRSWDDVLGEANATEARYNLADQIDRVMYPATGQNGDQPSVSETKYLYPGGQSTGSKLFGEDGALMREVTVTLGHEGESRGTSGSTEAASVEYDGAYRPIVVRDGKNNETRYSYNDAGYLMRVQHPGGQSVWFLNYDEAGRVGRRKDANDVFTTFGYNDPFDPGALSDITYPATPGRNVHFEYDLYDRLRLRSDGTGSQDYTYGEADELQRVATTFKDLVYTGLPTRMLGYTYHPDGSRAGMTTPAGAFSYQYDGAGRPQSLTNPSGETTSWSYLPNGALHTQTLANGVQTTYGNDNPGDLYGRTVLGQIRELTNRNNATGQDLSRFTNLWYDDAGNQRRVLRDLPGISSGLLEHAYDAKDQLRQERFGGQGGPTFDYDFDEAGNPTLFQGQGRSYNPNNQLEGFGIGYDNNGNPISYGGQSLTYSPNDELTSYGNLLSAEYTAEGLRSWKQDSNNIRTYFLYDGVDPVLELDSGGNVSALNSFGANGLISRNTPVPGSSGGSTFYSFDEKGDVAQRLDGSGNVVSTHQFQAFGQAVAGSDPNPDPFGYKGQDGYYTDNETGLILCTFRYYDPSTGRWLTRDPIGMDGGINLYGYVTNNPVNLSDPLGLSGDEDDLPLSGRALYGQAFQQGKGGLCNMAQNRAGSEERRTFSDMLGSVPLLGGLWNAYRAGTGNDPVAGTRLSKKARFAVGVAVLATVGGKAGSLGSAGKVRNLVQTADEATALKIVNRFRGNRPTRYIPNRDKTKVIGEVTTSGPKRVIRYPHVDGSTPYPHYNLEDATANTNLHLIIKN